MTEAPENDNVPDKCPPPGTSEYDSYIEKQSRKALIDAMNAHPILRVCSTFVIVILGTGILFSALDGFRNRPMWAAILSCVVFGVYGLSVLSYLRYCWGKRRLDYPDD